MVRCVGSDELTYSPYTLPLRTALYDAQGRIAKPWIDYLAAIARKAGRSVTWMGVYDAAREYAVGDVVREGSEEDGKGGSLWMARQAQPINGGAVEPGTDDTVWELVYEAPIPAGGTEGQILAKASDTDFDMVWEDPPPASIPLSTDTVLLSGGLVVWTSGYDFSVSPADYLILGASHLSPLAAVTLTAADATLDRIDVIGVDDTGSVIVIEGDLGATPVQPTVDPAHQLALTFVLVTHATSAPVGTSNALIYDEAVEWTPSTSGSGWNTASTTNPNSGSKDIEASAVAKNSYVQLQAGAPVDLSSYANLVFYLRSKAAWSTQRYLSVSWLSAGAARGTAVVVKEGSFTFVSSNTASYQQIVIPLSLFGSISGTINQLRIAIAGGGGSATIGFYLDGILLQAGVTPPPTPLVTSVFSRTGAIVAQAGDYTAAQVGAVPTARTITTTSPLQGGGDLSANRTLSIDAFTGDTGTGGAKGAVPAPAAGDAAAGKVLGAGGGWVAGGGGSGTVTHTGGALTADEPVFGAGTADIKVGTKSGNTNELATVSGALTAGNILVADAAGNLVDGGAPPTDGVDGIDGADGAPGADGAAAPLVIGYVINDGSTGTNIGPMLASSHAGSVTKCVVVTKGSHATTDLTFAIKKNGTSVFSSSPTVAAATASGTVDTFTGLTSSPLSIAADDVFSIDIASGEVAWQFTAQLE